MGRFSDRVFGWQIDAFLRKAVQCGYIAHEPLFVTTEACLVLNDADNKLIKSVKMPTHCLHELLPLVCLLDFGTLTILRNCLYAFMLARPYSKVCIVFYFSCFFHLMMTFVRHFIKRQTAYLLT